MEMKMAELTGEDLNKLMIDYDRLSEDFRQRGGLPMNLTSELFSMVLSLMKACGGCLFQISLVAKIPFAWLKCF